MAEFAQLRTTMVEATRLADPRLAHAVSDDVLIEALKACALLAMTTHPEAASELEDLIGTWQHASSMRWTGHELEEPARG